MSTLVAKSRTDVNALLAAGKTSATLGDASCLLTGLTGMDAIANFAGHACVLVANGTVGICQSSAHSPPSIGASATIGGNTYTIADIQSIFGTDICFAKLDRKVTSVAPITVIPADDPAWSGTMAGMPAVWVVVRSGRIQLMEMSDADAGGADEGKAVIVKVSDDPRLVIGTPLVAGDSDSPLVSVINSAAVLLATAFSSLDGSDISAYHADAEALWVSAWGITDAYTEADLSGFDAYNTPLETVTVTAETSGNSVAVTCSPGSLGTVYGQVFLQWAECLAGRWGSYLAETCGGNARRHANKQFCVRGGDRSNHIHTGGRPYGYGLYV